MPRKRGGEDGSGTQNRGPSPSPPDTVGANKKTSTPSTSDRITKTKTTNLNLTQGTKVDALRTATFYFDKGWNAFAQQRKKQKWLLHFDIYPLQNAWILTSRRPFSYNNAPYKPLWDRGEWRSSATNTLSLSQWQMMSFHFQESPDSLCIIVLAWHPSGKKSVTTPTPFHIFPVTLFTQYNKQQSEGKVRDVTESLLR